MENTADSVFCSHGAGVVIPWREVAQHAQVDSGWRPQGTEPEPKEAPPQRRPVSTYAGTAAQDKELQAIFERTYGAVKRESFLPPKAPKRPVADHSEEKRRELKQAFSGEDYLLVDGYNIIFAWDERSIWTLPGKSCATSCATIRATGNAGSSWCLTPTR